MTPPWAALHLNENHTVSMKFSSLFAHEVVKMTHYGASIDKLGHDAISVSVYTERKSLMFLSYLDVVSYINKMTTGQPRRRQRWDLLFHFRILFGLVRLYSIQLYVPNTVQVPLAEVTSVTPAIRSERRFLKFQHKTSKNTIIKMRSL